MQHSRKWLSEVAQKRVLEVQDRIAQLEPNLLQNEIEILAKENHAIHDKNSINLNPATNVLNPRAEKILSTGLSSRASLGHPGDKYEVGLDAIEQIEVITGDLACKLFESKYVEFRVGSGALANLYAFMATCKPGDKIIAPPASIGGHITHHKPGAAGLYGLDITEAPVDENNYTVDVDKLRKLAHEIKPKLITIGGSLNLFPHPVKEIREIADEVGAKLLFDAAHQCGLIAGKVWPQPLSEGAHLMTFSTYKSLGGPAGGLIITNEEKLAEKIDAIAYPGLTANYDPAKTAALGITLQDWNIVGEAYAKMMVETSIALAKELDKKNLHIYAKEKGFTTSHQFAIVANELGGGQRASKKLALSGLLACGINVPGPAVEDDTNAIRIGTPEVVRMGMKKDDMPLLADLIFKGLTTDTPDLVQAEVIKLRKKFNKVHYTLDQPE
ncbi:MAG: aminotransferase class I/II-fold pyridoxal phosphate-dependent enzyme [Proteobacteria bacterium]|nr:aminotransferase class I/II-fold pyridoxal phosphate-dependent enzyme [Pseudomonadota bacterium]